MISETTPKLVELAFHCCDHYAAFRTPLPGRLGRCTVADVVWADRATQARICYGMYPRLALIRRGTKYER
jgi:hypothetical protein